MKTVSVIEAVFFAALDKHAPAERAAYLDRACDGDPDLRRCVEKLLAAQPRVGDFLQAPAAGLPAAGDAPAGRPGTRLGPYKLLHEIGEGGMGTVWMAEQEEPIRRRVALKVIKPGMDSRQILVRFEAERQALALMDHPNIARVLDAGATAGGRPYFVMELVKGQPINEFCDKNRLTTRERLELFVPVCNAIQHAHQKGIIHRDIKPSNVLVALYDGTPVPKVIDFGVAKATAEPLTTKTLFTRHGQVVGTFEYMSPEQARLDQLDIDTRSDIYALGVLLYELLTGTTPLDKERLRQGGLAEVLRLIREEEPPKPSARLTSSPGLLALAAACRRSDAQQLPRAVRGELDWIVMKALDKDRNRRFATANGLALDVERYLKDEPVQACPPTLGYRVRKFARKNKVAFATGTAVAAALLVGVALTAWQAVRATAAERAAGHERDRTAAALDDALQIGKELDARLLDVNAAHDRLRRTQAEARANQYAWDMQLLPITWEAGNVADARRMLGRQPDDLRGFEWHYWARQAHPERASAALLPAAATRPPPNREWVFSGDGGRVALRTTSTFDPTQNAVTVWDAATRQVLLSHAGPPDGTQGRYYSDGSSSVAMSYNGKRILLIDQTTDAPPRERPAPAAAPEVRIRVLEVDGGRVIFDSRTHPGGRLSPFAHLSRDGSKLVTETVHPRALLWAPVVRGTVWDLVAAGKNGVAIEGANAVALSPDGSRLLGFTRPAGTAPGDTRQTKTKVWDATAGAELLSWDDGRALAYSPDGALLAGTMVIGTPESGQTRVLKLYDATTGKELWSVPLLGNFSRLPPGFGQGIRSADRTRLAPLVFSPDGSRLAAPHSYSPIGGGAERVEWHVVDPQTGTILRTLEDPAPGSAGQWAARFFSTDGAQFVCCDAHIIHTFDATTGRQHTLRGHENPIGHAVPTADGRLRSVELDGTIKDWDPRPAEPARIAATRTPTNALSDVAISADGAWVARVQIRGDEQADCVEVWDGAGNGATVLAARPRPRAAAASGRYILGLSGDGRRVALARYEVRKFGGRKADPAEPAVSPDLTVWDVARQTELFHTALDAGDTLYSDAVAFAPDGTRVAVLRPEREGNKTVRSTLTVFDVDSGRPRPPITIPGALLAPPRFDPAGTRLAGVIRIPAGDSSFNEKVAVWDVDRGGEVFAFELSGSDPADFRSPGAGLGTPVWSPDGTRLAVPDETGGQTRLLDTTTGKPVITLKASATGRFLRTSAPAAFSPDGRRLVCHVPTRSGADVLSVLDTGSGKELLTLPLPGRANGLGFAPLAFSADGYRLHRFTTERKLEGSFGQGRPAWQESILVTTWDATPRPEPKER